MSPIRSLVVGSVFGLVLGLSSCGTSSSCSAASCPMGCCTADNQCLPGSTTSACGTGGKACAVCQGAQACTLGACGAAATGGGSAGGATAGGAAGGAMGGGAAGGAMAGGAAGGATAGGSAGGNAGGAGSANLVVNELFVTGNANDPAIGPDYVELFNAGTAAQDLSGFSLTDTETSDGGPKPREGVVFPAGTSLAAGAFLLIVGDRADAGVSSDCLGATAPCFGARFGLSNNGETVFVLDAQGQVFTSQAYPAAPAPAGSSYGRFPDGTGSFGTTQKTPGRANAQ